MSLIVGFMPWLFARKPTAGLERVAKGFFEYWHNGGIEKGSHFALARRECYKKHGVDIMDGCRFEVAGAIGKRVT